MSAARMETRLNDNGYVAVVEGYAAIFRERDLNDDIVAPGAFARSLKNSTPVRMLYQHTAETPIGRWLSFHEDSVGLYVKGELLLSSPKAREVHGLIAGGALDGLSIGYQTVKARKGPAGARRIIEANLWEVSIVTFPMAPRARIAFIGDPKPVGAATPPSRAFSSPGARPARRASSTTPQPLGEARQFAEALRSAAASLSV